VYRDHHTCRACGNQELIPVFDLGIQPLANDFRKPGEARNGFAPLQVLFCPKCTLAQLSVVVDPVILYEDYPYVTSPSQTMKHHFDRLSADIELQSGHGTLVEIGSNDGLFLKHLSESGWQQLVGIDPAVNLSPAASARGVRTINSLFDEQSAKDALRLLGEVDAVVARHVFAHIDNWKEFVRCLEVMSNTNTTVYLECPYALDILNHCEWDTIYHEHLSYVTIRSMEALLKDTKFHLHKVTAFPVHGGAIVMTLRRNDSTAQRDRSVDDYLEREKITDRSWFDFTANACQQIRDLKAKVLELHFEGKTVCGFGASAKSTVAINAAGIAGLIQFITDTTPQKQGRLSPGTDIPIVPPEELLARQPDYAICHCWNFRSEVLKNNEEYLKRGGHFIFFVPRLEVV
jgi:novobiocin biosynthesis protein NovU/D-mycarose 3-C-methyltransferase